MLERNIKLYEPIEFIVFLVLSGLYYIGLNENFFERFDYDINVFIVISIICLILGLKNIPRTEEAFQKHFFSYLYIKKPKLGVKLNTWPMLQLTRKINTVE